MGLKPVSTINITIDGGGSQVVEETLNTFNTQNKTYEISELVKDGNIDFTLPVTVSVGEKENVVKDTTVRWGENITVDPSVRIREADGSLSSWKSITGSETTINSSISAKGSIGSLVPGNNYNQGYYTGGTVETTNVTINEVDGSTTNVGSVSGNSDRVNSSLPQRGSIGNLMPGDYDYDGYYSSGRVGKTTVRINEVDGSTTYHGNVSGYSDRVNSSLPQRGSIGSLMPGEYGFDGYYDSGRVGETTVRINEVDGSTTYHGDVDGSSERVDSNLPQQGSIGDLMPGDYGYDGYYEYGRVGETTVRINEVDGTTTYAGDVSGSSDRVNSEIPQRGSLNSVTPGAYESEGYYDGGTIPKGGGELNIVETKTSSEAKNWVNFPNSVDYIISSFAPVGSSLGSYSNDAEFKSFNIKYASETKLGVANTHRDYGYNDTDKESTVVVHTYMIEGGFFRLDSKVHMFDHDGDNWYTNDDDSAVMQTHVGVSVD